MDKRFRIVRVPDLPRDTVQAIDSQVCLWGTGSGKVEIQDAEIPDLGVPLLNSGVAPIAETPRPAPYSGTLIENPRSNGAKVNYVIDGVSYELKPGESRSHKTTAKSQITFNQNATKGNARYTLSPRTYQFLIQARAWQVQTVTYSALIDNSANAQAFQCEVNGQPRVVPAHKTLQLQGTYPISVRFDKGNGEAIASKVIRDTSTVVTVGVAPGTVGLDLFPGKSRELAARPLNIETIASQSTTPSPATGRQSILPTVDDLQ